jgi:hypothetical protein
LPKALSVRKTDRFTDEMNTGRQKKTSAKDLSVVRTTNG